MEQHPIPQNISSYQFRLVGDMTLKQFFQLAGGILVGLLFYSSPLLAIIKWPFAVVSVILGVALAFLPLEERPLEKWLLAFFRAIYSPTLFYWQKLAVQPKFFQDEAGPTIADVALPKQGAPTPLDKLELAEKGFLSALTNLFSGVAPVPITETKQELKIPTIQPINVAQVDKPKIVVEERKPEPVATPTVTASTVAPTIAGNEMVTLRAAMFSPMAAPPTPSTYPNVAVGQVIDQDRRLVDGAIIEIRDSEGRPIRAIRSNKLGHFITVTPLENGRYDIATEKEGYEFTPVFFETDGEIIPPILVQGKNLNPEIL